MAEYGAIPAELSGVPIPALSDVQVSAQRAVQQNVTTDGVRTTYGKRVYTASITFKTLKDRASFLRKLPAADGSDSDVEGPSLTYKLGADRFTLTNLVDTGITAQSDQNGSSSLVIQVAAEEHIDEGA